jgi:beta-lactam-binding protein with PASTA domain
MKLLKVLGAHSLLIVIFLVAVITITSFVLRSITRHGEALSVPNLTGLLTDDAIEILMQKKLRFIITDSMYFSDKPKLSVLDQNPSPNSKVKEGRIIYLTINTDRPPLVSMPNLTDVSLRQAEAILKSVGLKVGKLSYKPDIAQNVVLEQIFGGKAIEADAKIPKGSSVDLVLGDGLIDAPETEIPDLNGFTLDEARNLLTSASLNIGAVVFQGLVSDSNQVRVIRQLPPARSIAKAGQTVDIYLKQP